MEEVTNLVLDFDFFKIKNGYKTTEFWLALSMPILTLLMIFGIVPDVDVPVLDSAWEALVTDVFAVIGSALVIWKYIDSRTKVKTNRVVSVGEALPSLDANSMEGGFAPE